MSRSIEEELQEISGNGLLRTTRLISGRQSARVTHSGRDMLLLCSNNYLGLADRPELINAAVQAAESYGTSSGASRLVSGTMELHEQLENAVAIFKQSEAALVFNSGHAANTGIIPAIVKRGDIVFSDRLNHASIVDGILLSGAKMIRYPHNDHVMLEQLLEKYRGKNRTLIVTDGVFSMDGDVAPLVELVALKQAYNALLMVDDAHGSGVLGECGRGSADQLGVADFVDIKMGTFGKALGSFGAYAAVTSEMRTLLVNRCRSFIFSTSLPPAVLGASLAAVRIVQSSEGDLLRDRIRANTEFFRRSLNDAGFIIPPGTTQIIPIITGSPETTMRFSEALLNDGIFAQGIRPPTVPAGSGRVRFTVMATHTPEELSWAVERIKNIGSNLGVI